MTMPDHPKYRVALKGVSQIKAAPIEPISVIVDIYRLDGDEWKLVVEGKHLPIGEYIELG